MLSEEATNTNFIVFGMIRPGLVLNPRSTTLRAKVLIITLSMPLLFLFFNLQNTFDRACDDIRGVISLSQHSIFYIGTGKKKMLAM